MKTLKKGYFELVDLLAAGPIPKVRGKGADLVDVNLTQKIVNIKIFPARELTSPEESSWTTFLELDL